MQNKAIYNKKNDTVKIDLVGTFGDDWFSDISKNFIIDILNEHPNSDLIVNLSSLGGSVDTALAARDWILLHKGNTKVRLLGRNASASTFFATAFDEVEISEGGMFLVHNVWGLAIGDSEELRKTADDFDKHNEIIVNIYRKKTGKSTDEIRDLMHEEKWINAEEAKEWGFVDRIFAPEKQDNKYNLLHAQQTIYNKYLPKLEEMDNTGIGQLDEQTFFNKMGDFFKNLLKPVEKEENKEEVKKEPENKEEVKVPDERDNKIEELTNKVNELTQTNADLNAKLAANSVKTEPTKEQDTIDTDKKDPWDLEVEKMKNSI